MFLTALVCAVMLVAVFGMAMLGVAVSEQPAEAASYTYTFNFISKGVFQWSQAAQSSYTKGDTIKVATDSVTELVVYFNDSYVCWVGNDDSYVYNVTSDCVTLTLNDSGGDVSTTVFIEESFPIVFDLNGGEGVTPTETKKCKVGDSIFLPGGNDIEKLDAEFAGWSTNKNAKTGSTGTYTIVAGDKGIQNITFYAIWKYKYSIAYDLNMGIGTTPTNTNKYEDGDTTFTFASTAGLTKANSTILGWALTNDATEALTSYTISGDDAVLGTITFYAVWLDHEYKDEVSITCGDLTYGTTCASINPQIVSGDGLKIVEYALIYDECKATPTYTSKASVDVTGCYYILVVLSGETIPFYFSNDNDPYALYYENGISIDTDFTEAYSYDCYGAGVKNYNLSTNSSALSTSTDATYLLISIKVVLLGNAVEYDADTEETVTGMPTENTTRYLNGATVPVPTEKPTRANYKFLGWATESNGTVITTTTVEMGESDITFYGVWAAKDAVNVSENAQSFDYDASGITYEVSGTKLSGFTVEYYVGGNWTTIVPTHAGKYDVKITREEDANNLAYSKVITDGLVINKVEAYEPTIKGTELIGSETKVILEGVEDYMTTSDSFTQTEAGTYTITFTLDENHVWANGSDGVVTWEIAAVDVVSAEEASIDVVSAGEAPIMDYLLCLIILVLMVIILIATCLVYRSNTKGKGVLYALLVFNNAGYTTLMYYIMGTALSNIILFAASCVVFALNLILAIVFTAKGHKKNK